MEQMRINKGKIQSLEALLLQFGPQPIKYSNILLYLFMYIDISVCNQQLMSICTVNMVFYIGVLGA